MPNKRSSKTKDIEQIAADILEEAVGEPAPITPVGKKNPAAMAARRAVDLKRDAARAKTKAKVKAKRVSPKTRKT